MSSPQYDFAMVGLGTMGRNLLLNIADHGYSVVGFDRDENKTAQLETSAGPGSRVKGVNSLQEMVSLLSRPKKVMLLVPAGPPVDAVIGELLPLLEEGDIVIDGGNSHFSDTLARVRAVEGSHIHFMGMGVSGGEMGARTGPSIMPGGDQAAWQYLKPILEAIAAKVNGEPCVAYMGKNAAGHYVKMVHNGIEYAIMQLISEVYDFLKRALGCSNQELHDIFSQWNQGEMQSFLIEISADIFDRTDDLTGGHLVDMVLDKAGSKGTGKWTSQEAMDLPVALPTIDMAVAMRDMSGYKEERVMASALHKPVIRNLGRNREKIIPQLHDALYLATLLAYAQGLSMLAKASLEKGMDIPMKDVVRIWRGGCIIRSAQLEIFTAAYKKNPALTNILLDKKIAVLVRKKQLALRRMVQQFAAARIPGAAMMSALSYLDAYTCERLPINLVQAQRDYFGAHTYQRTDRPGSFHTEW